MRIIDTLTGWCFRRGALPHLYVLALDLSTVFVGAFLGRYMEVGGDVFAGTFWPFFYGLLICLVAFTASFRLHHTYRGIVRFSSFVDLIRCLYATFIGSVLTLAAGQIVEFFHWDRFVIVPSPLVTLVIFLFSTMAMWLIRVAVKSLYDMFRNTGNFIKVAIYGVKEGGIAIAKDLGSQDPRQYRLTCFISPEGDMMSDFLMDVHVYPDDNCVVDLLKSQGVKAVMVSPLQSEHFREREDLINGLIEAGIRIMMVPEVEEWDGKSPLQQDKLREVEIEDLLPREKIEVNMEAIGSLLTGRKILITGAAGSIGSEMVRQIAVYHPAEMVLIDQAETPMHDIRLMMRKRFPDVKAMTIVASITDAGYMDHIFAAHRPEYVFHAAAYKHVPMMEDNPVEAVSNNIYGTRVIADLAVKYSARKFVMISTDKAVNPTNVMGCSKRICEIYCQSLNQAIVSGKVQGVTQFVTTRFGNVLGSNGSVIPLFKRQIREGGPITVTHPDIIRFFMLIPEACKLVLQAGTMGHGGEIFVFDMGKPVRIVDLAKRMIALSGAKDVEIKFTGLRNGEKLYEELLSDKENTVPTDHPKILVAKVREYDYETACANEQKLMAAAADFDDQRVLALMHEIVPEYHTPAVA